MDHDNRKSYSMLVGTLFISCLAVSAFAADEEIAMEPMAHVSTMNAIYDNRKAFESSPEIKPHSLSDMGPHMIAVASNVGTSAKDEDEIDQTAQQDRSKQGLAGKNAYWSVQFENDFFANSGDRYYTHGTQISRLVMNEPPGWLRRTAQLFPAYQSDNIVNGVNYTFGQTIFTPDDTKSTTPAENDRPYAGYLYGSAALLSRVSHNDISDIGNLLEFTIGIVGPWSLAREAQTSFHDLIGIDSPQGWDNQLHNELGLGVSYSRFWRMIKPVSNGLEFGITPHLTAALGNVYTYAAAGSMFRLGTHLGNDLSPPNIRPGFPGISLFNLGKKHNLYLFAGMEGRIVARNIFLDGNTFLESHSVEKKILVGDMQIGLAFQLEGVRLSISNMFRTKEFTTQQGTDHYGAVNISFDLE